MCCFCLTSAHLTDSVMSRLELFGGKTHFSALVENKDKPSVAVCVTFPLYSTGPILVSAG